MAGSCFFNHGMPRIISWEVGATSKTERFFIAGGMKDDRIVLCDVTCPGLTSIDKNEGYWIRLRTTRELILLREVVINKATLSSTVYHSSSWHPPFRF